MTNGTSTGLDAAMIAMESAPPGLVARYAVSGSIPANTTSAAPHRPQIAISAKIAAAICGSRLSACTRMARLKRRPMLHPRAA